MVQEKYITLLKERLSKKRYDHSLEVMKEAVRLAKAYGADCEKAALAGLLHDVTKELPEAEQLSLCEKFGITLSESELRIPKILHAVTGAAYMREVLAITDVEVLDAVKYHTTGREKMTMLDKVIYLADCIEPTRNYYGVAKIREALKIGGVDSAIFTALTGSIESLLHRDGVVNIDSVKARNYLLLHSIG